MPVTKLLLNFLLFFISTNLFAANYNLPNNQWRLISLPENPPASENTISKVFEDDISGGVYGDNWVLYQYDTQKNSYGEALKLSDSLEQGRGYWIIQKTGSTVTLKMPAGSSEAADTYALKIASVSGNNSAQWTLSGNPFSSSQTLGGFFLKTDSGACVTPCDLDKAKAEKLLHNQVWIYDGGKYVLKNTQDTLSPWDGFWAASLASSQGLKLSLQKVSVSQSDTYYVATNGNDGNSGSKESPFGTINHAASTLNPGDTLVVMKGSYPERVTINVSGTSNKPIFIKGENGAIIDGADVPGPRNEGEHCSTECGPEYGLVQLRGSSHIFVENLVIRNYGNHGLSVTPGGEQAITDIVIRNNRVEDMDGAGIIVYGKYPVQQDPQYRVSNVTIDNNEVIRVQRGAIDPASDTRDKNRRYQEDITVGGGVEIFTITNNLVDSEYSGAKFHGGPLGIDVKDGVKTGVIESNTVKNVPSSGIYVDAYYGGASNIGVFYNRVSNTTAYGINVAAEMGGPVNRIEVRGNRIDDTQWSGIVLDAFLAEDDKVARPPGDHESGSYGVEGRKRKDNISILNNVINKVGQAPTTAGYSTGIRVNENRSSGIISGNTFRENVPLNSESNKHYFISEGSGITATNQDP